MKNQNGITFMILVVTILIMSLIFGAISYNSISGYRLNVYQLMCTDIELLDEKIALYYLEHDKQLPITDEYIKIDELIENYGEGNVNYNPNNSDSGMLFKIDLSKLDNLTLQNSNYYIDEQSHTIYTSSGKKMGDTLYYTVPTEYQKVELNSINNL